MSFGEFAFKLCSDCAAQNRPDAGQCWLCGGSLAQAPVVDPSRSTSAAPPPPRSAQASPGSAPAGETIWAEIVPPEHYNPHVGDRLKWQAKGGLAAVGVVVLVAVFCVVLIGVFQEAAGLGILFLLCSAPGLIAVLLSAARGRAMGAAVPWTSKLVTFMLVSTLSTVLAAAAAIVTFFVVCIVAIMGSTGGGGMRGDSETIMTIVGVVGGVVALLGVVFSIWLGLNLNRPR